MQEIQTLLMWIQGLLIYNWADFFLPQGIFRIRGQKIPHLMDINRSRIRQGIWIFCSFALKLNWISIKCKKPPKIIPFFAQFENFCRFFNFNWILAQNITKFTFYKVCQYFWHLPYLWICLSSGWKKIGAFQAVCVFVEHACKLEICSEYLCT